MRQSGCRIFLCATHGRGKNTACPKWYIHNTQAHIYHFISDFGTHIRTTACSAPPTTCKLNYKLCIYYSMECFESVPGPATGRGSNYGRGAESGAASGVVSAVSGTCWPNIPIHISPQRHKKRCGISASAHSHANVMRAHAPASTMPI